MSPKMILDVSAPLARPPVLAHRDRQISEKLYNRGLLSYPRTETDQYDKAFDFRALIEKQTSDAAWGAFATRLNNGEFERPRDGNKNDKAHPPIHPTSHDHNLSGDEKRVYDYVTRRFLASCHKDGVGRQTTVDIDIAKEQFKATGELQRRDGLTLR
jgi:DNA topoisomerase-3